MSRHSWRKVSDMNQPCDPERLVTKKIANAIDVQRD